MKEKFIDDLLKQLIPILLNGINEENEVNEIQTAYKVYIMKIYENISVNETNFDKLFSVFLKKEIGNLNSMSVAQKKSQFLTDENMELLIKLSNEAMDLKMQTVKNNTYISKEYAEKRIQQMGQLINYVKPFNGQVAQQYLSEGSLDYSYAAGLTTFHSFRTAHYCVEKKTKQM